MARPLTIIYQDLQQASATPAVPDLNSVICGPAYVVRDYPDDAATILLDSAYGQLEQPAGGASAYTPPDSSATAVTVVAYPGNAAGALVDHASVRLFLQTPRVIMGSTYLSSGYAPVLGGKITTFSTVGLENKVTFNTGPVSLVTNGIKAGDRLIATSSTGTEHFVGVVASVGEPDANGVVTDAFSLRLTANVPATGWTADANGECRIERALLTQEYVDTTGLVLTFPVAGTDTLAISGGLKIKVDGVDRAVSYAKLYLGYRALRQDLASDVDFVTASDVVLDAAGRTSINKLGLVDARNPLAAGVWVALQNAGTSPIYYVGVQQNDASGHLAARVVTESRRDLWAFVPLTDNLSVIGGYKLEWEQLADPNYALENGVPQKFRAVIGNTTLPVNSTIVPSSVTGVTAQPATTLNTGKRRTVELRSAVDVSSVVVGDLLTIGLVPAGGSWATRRGTHTVAHVNKSAGVPTGGDHATLEILPGTSRWNDGATDTLGAAEFVIKSPAGVVKVSRLAQLQLDDGAGSPNGVLFAMKIPTVSGGPYRIAYTNTAPSSTPVISIVGFDITIAIQTTVTTYNQIISAVNNHVTLSQLMTASLVGTSGPQAATVALTNVSPVTSVGQAAVLANDDLFVWLFDATATFLSSGVKVGDVLQIPQDPNDYSPSAFSGPLLSYKVAQVISENRVQVEPLGDDSPSAANELPHYYNRVLPNRYIDNETSTSSSAIRYQIVRKLTTDDQVTQLIAVGQSLRSKRAVVVWPDLCDVDGLKDGGAARDAATPTVPALAGSQPGWYIACQLAGALAGLPVQHGLTGLGLVGIKKLYHTNKYFREAQLTKLSDGGLCVMHQKTPNALPECIHQLTTDVTAIETGEISVVRNVDYVSVTFQDVIDPFLGRWNVLPETLSAIFEDVNKTITELKGRKVARIGAPLVSAEITSLKVSDVAANRVVMFTNIKVPVPLNGVDVHLVI